METLGQTDVREEILPAVVGPRPAGVLRDHLPAQFVADAQPFQRPQARDALSPVRVLGLAYGAPVA